MNDGTKHGNLNLKIGKSCPKQTFRQGIYRDSLQSQIILDSNDIEYYRMMETKQGAYRCQDGSKSLLF